MNVNEISPGQSVPSNISSPLVVVILTWGKSRLAKLDENEPLPLPLQLNQITFVIKSITIIPAKLSVIFEFASKLCWERVRFRREQSKIILIYSKNA